MQFLQILTAIVVFQLPLASFGEFSRNVLPLKSGNQLIVVETLLSGNRVAAEVPETRAKDSQIVLSHEFDTSPSHSQASLPIVLNSKKQYVLQVPENRPIYLRGIKSFHKVSGEFKWLFRQ